MRFDLEQFLALTMALSTAGAAGVAIYTSRATPAEARAAEAGAEDEWDDEAFPQAEPEPEPSASSAVAAPPPVATPAAVPALDAAPEELEAAPGPTVEGMSW